MGLGLGVLAVDWLVCFNDCCRQVAEGGGGDVGEVDAGAPPEEPGNAWADCLQTFQVERVLAGAEADAASRVAHGVQGGAADLAEGWSGCNEREAVEGEAGAVAGQQVEAVAAVDGDVDEAVVDGGVRTVAAGLGCGERGGVAELRYAFLCEIGEIGPSPWVNPVIETGSVRRFGLGISPAGDDDQA